jgi:hypothetical protein
MVRAFILCFRDFGYKMLNYSIRLAVLQLDAKSMLLHGVIIILCATKLMSVNTFLETVIIHFQASLSAYYIRLR